MDPGGDDDVVNETLALLGMLVTRSLQLEVRLVIMIPSQRQNYYLMQALILF